MGLVDSLRRFSAQPQAALHDGMPSMLTAAALVVAQTFTPKDHNKMMTIIAERIRMAELDVDTLEKQRAAIAFAELDNDEPSPRLSKINADLASAKQRVSNLLAASAQEELHEAGRKNDALAKADNDSEKIIADAAIRWKSIALDVDALLDATAKKLAEQEAVFQELIPHVDLDKLAQISINNLRLALPLIVGLRLDAYGYFKKNVYLSKTKRIVDFVPAVEDIQRLRKTAKKHT